MGAWDPSIVLIADRLRRRRIAKRIAAEEVAARIRGIVLTLRAERQRLGLSQERLEQDIGLTKGHVEKWERGVRSPGTFYLTCWAEALGLQVALVPISTAPAGPSRRTARASTPRQSAIATSSCCS